MRIMITLAAAVATLSACHVEPTRDVIESSREKTGESTLPTVPVKMPPSIAATKQYRCADGSLALVEYYSDDLSASVRTVQNGPAVRVVAPAKGQPMTGGNHVLDGDRSDDVVMFASPEHPKTQRCHV